MGSNAQAYARQISRQKSTIGAQSAKIKKLEAEVEKLTQERDSYHNALITQAVILSDAGDIMEELGLRNVWINHLNMVTGQPKRSIGAVQIWENGRAQHYAREEAAQEAKAILKETKLAAQNARLENLMEEKDSDADLSEEDLEPADTVF